MKAKMKQFSNPEMLLGGSIGIQLKEKEGGQETNK